MKARHFIGSMILLLGVCSTLQAGVINTKHNFSTTGPGTIKATAEPEVCVFCHIPHSTQVGTPLWNRSMPSSSYTMYNSDYLRRMNYPTPTALGNTVGSPGTLSRQCLSCHDGTVAVGSVYLVRGTLMGSTQIAMSGVTGSGTMPVAAAGYIGTDLRGHHPVGIEYNSTLLKGFGSGSRGTELLATPGAAIKLYTYNNKQYVECSSCHDPHTETSKFLRYSSGGTHGANVYGTCTSCHEKTNWATGAHATVTNVYADTTVNATYGTSTVDSLGCVNCHKPHNGEGKPYLLRKVEENTCFQGAGSGTTSTVPCHGTGGAKDIQSILTSVTKVYRHPVADAALQGNHSNLDVFFGTNVASDGGTGVTWSANKHAECTDCHNPHQAKAGSHAPAGSWYPATATATTNAVSGPLTGVTGVEPTWPGVGWTQPTTFTTQESATKEYQICMKCHSYWGLGSASNGISVHTITSEGVPATDQAYEFNPKNRSAHPVVMTTIQMKAAGGNTNIAANEGRYATPLTAAALKSPWNGSPGNQTMMCSDCHGADSENTGADPKGPHGSSVHFMLKGTNKNWPAGPDGSGAAVPGGKLYTMADGQLGKQIFCLNCHVYEPEPIDGTITVHSSSSGQMQNNACVECHIAVPHGGKVSRLIGYDSMPSPYNYTYGGRAYLGLKGYRQKAASTWTGGTTGNLKKNAYTTSALCSTSCHTGNDAGYDVYP